MRDWLMQKSQPKVEIIELSPMSTAPVTPQVKLQQKIFFGEILLLHYTHTVFLYI